MLGSRTNILLICAMAVLVFPAAVRSDEISWMPGLSSPLTWSIEPAKPLDTRVIQFSGPAPLYANPCKAEDALGGKPVLLADPVTRTVEVRFEPPARSDCGDAWFPVCGLEGKIGPLKAGQWRFFSTHATIAFSMEFSVGDHILDLPIFYVDANAPGAATGLTWRDAFVHLQDALAIATADSEIRVARGTYKPDMGGGMERGDRAATFWLKNGVVLKGGYAGSRSVNPNERNVVDHETILSGDLYGDDWPVRRLSDLSREGGRSDNSNHVVTISGTDATAVLDGFTVTGGHATESEVADEVPGGGGIFGEDGSATIRDCSITGNSSIRHGGGIYVRGECAPTFVGCMVADNWAHYDGGGVYCRSNSEVVFSRCVVAGNGVHFAGGGISSHGNGQLWISNSIISGNQALEPTWGRGGGLYNSLTRTDVSHCTFTGNVAALGSSVWQASSYSKVRLSNCILWDDREPVGSEDQAVVEVTYGDIRGGWPGQGNIDADPCFVRPGFLDDRGTPLDPCDNTWIEGDYHLRWDSPCLDAGALDLVWDVNETDLDGRPRLSGNTVDMGAYELQNDPPVADAGRDVTGFTLDGVSGLVTLDASRSYDPEGMALKYQWFREDRLISEEVRFTVELPVGQHVLTLMVADPVGVTASDTVAASVTAPIGARSYVSPQTIARHGGKEIVMLTVLPRGMQPKDFDQSEPLLLFPGRVKPVRQSVLKWLSGDTLVLGTFKAGDLAAVVPENGRVELRVVGRLANGQFFSGTDFVTIY